MALPTQIQKQVKDADKKMQKYMEEKDQKPAAPKPDEAAAKPDEGSPAPPPADPPADPAAPAPAEPADKKAEPDKAEPPKEDSAEYWKHKYDVLNGKYKKEVPALHDQNKRTQEQLVNVETLLATMQVPEEVQVGQAATVLTKEEVDDYGSDMISVMKKAAREELSPYINKLEEENKQLRGMLGHVSTTAAESARDVMLRTLDAEVPGWKEQNTDTNFVAWLQHPDVYSGVSRQQMLTEAFEKNHTARVVAFFKGYRDENAIEQGTQTDSPAPSEEPPPQPQVQMDTLVAPGAPAAGESSSAQSEKRYFTQAEIAAFYNDVRQGKFKRSPKEREKIEAEIFSAVNEGRIRF